MWFPKYFIWKVKRRYKRYLGGMEYKRLMIEKNERFRKLLMDNLLTKGNIIKL